MKCDIHSSCYIPELLSRISTFLRTHPKDYYLTHRHELIIEIEHAIQDLVFLPFAKGCPNCGSTAVHGCPGRGGLVGEIELHLCKKCGQNTNG